MARFTNAGDLHPMLQTLSQDGDPVPAPRLGLAERLGRRLLGLKTENKAGGATMLPSGSELSPKSTQPVKAKDISCQPPLLNPDVLEHVNTEDSAIVAKLVYLLQDQVLYQRLLTCRGKDAQTLLDLLQDVSNIIVLLPGEY
jgi:hypothetical protein